MTQSLQDRVAIVTGAGRGIGRAVAEKLARAGAAVVVNDLDGDAAQEVVTSIKSGDGRANAFVDDISAKGFGEACVDFALKTYGDLHIVVNNAGYIWNTAALNHTDEQWEEMMAVHATGPFRLLRAAGHHFRKAHAKERDGAMVTRKVVNTSSTSGVYGAPTQVSYAAGKAAIIGITKTLAREWGRYGVTVNCVAYGFIDTRLVQPTDGGAKEIKVRDRSYRVGLDAATIEEIARTTPLGRLGTPEDAAGAVMLFCLPESDFVSGQTLIVSGGRDT